MSSFVLAMVTAVFALAASAADYEAATRGLLERVLGPAAASQFSLALTVSLGGAPVEQFMIAGSAGRITIEASTPSALTQGVGWYLKYVAHADLMLRGAKPALAAVLPAPANVIRRTASVPRRYALNDTNDAYTDPNLTWEDWENELDLMALHGINEVYVTVGTDYVYYLLLQRYGYSADKIRLWIPDPAHQPWWVLQNLSGGEFAITDQLLQKRAALGRRIADRARELGIVPVFPGYWGTVPTDFAARNPGADVIPQGSWVGYARPGWLNPATMLFEQMAADYYTLSTQVLGASTMYKMDPLHEGGVLGHADLTASAGAIERALQRAHPGATWTLLAWFGNPMPALLAGIVEKSHVLLLASEADRYATWDSAQRWPGVPYAFGSIYNFGGHTTIGANLPTIVDRWFADQAGPNAGQLRGVAIFPESWTSNPVAAELMSELPWQASRFTLDDWLRTFAVGRYGTSDPHAAEAWSILGATAYGTPPDANAEGQDSLFNAQPSLTATAVSCCAYGRMRYSGPDLETAWRELLAAAPSVAQAASYEFDLTDLTRQVVVNRARVLLPMIRRAYEVGDQAQFNALSKRWLELMDLADQVEGTHVAFMLGPHLDRARANGSTAQEQAQLVHNAVNLVTNWGTREGFDAGLRDYANRDWNCLTRTYYKVRWAMYFDGLRQVLAGLPRPSVDWFAVGEDFASRNHNECVSTPSGSIVAVAQQARAALAAGPDASVVAEGWASYAENEAVFGFDGTTYRIESAGAALWQNVNRYGILYQRGALRDGGSATVRVASLQSEGGRPWARAGIMAGTNVVSSQPGGFVNIAITLAHGCVFSWAPDASQGLTNYTATATVASQAWVRLTRLGNTYVGSCSSDGVTWTIVGSAIPGDLEASADVGMFASAANAGGSDRFIASFDRWSMTSSASADRQIAIEYFHAVFGHYFITAFAEEIAKLDAGVFEGWRRTGQGFNVYATPGPGRVSVCRFFTVAFSPSSSHFYGPRGLGCEEAVANVDWLFEGEVFYAPLPDFDGTCPVGSAPIYRLYNNGQGGAPNHRFTTNPDIHSQMIAAGYIPEGRGAGVGMCSPQ